MDKNKKPIVIAIKGTLYIYIPVIVLHYIVYKIILKKDMVFFWNRLLIYSLIIGFSIMKNYEQKTIEEDVESFKSLKSLINKKKWTIIEHSQNRLIIKPKFDFLFRLLIDDKIQIDYSEQKAIIKGPWYYVDNIVKDINGKSNILTKSATNIKIIIVGLSLVFIPMVNELGIPWEIKTRRHNSFVENVKIIEIESKNILGNSVQNINNQGQGVENEDYIFYVENNLNLVQVNKDYGDKTYLIQESEGSNISRLNLAEDWIFYTRGKTLNRIRIDGIDDETIYKSGYALDVHFKDNWLYFINFSDNSNVYKIDINGRGLQRFLNVNASDIALYDNKIIVSYDSNNNSYLESISLDGVERRVELEISADSLVKWDGYYYFIGEESKLYRNKADGITAPELLVDDKVSSYVITDTGIFYSLHSEDVGYPGKDIYKVELDGTGNTLILDTLSVGGFTKVGDFVIFHSSVDYYEPEIKRLNIFTNEIEFMK